MKSRQCGFILSSLAYFIVISNHVNAGPASRRLTREIYPELEQENEPNQSQVCVVGDVVYGVDEMVPAEQPCLKCRCQPPGVLCEVTRCGSKKHGCKAVHRPNQCCPDYQCECEYNNKKYSNGERLEALPGDECKVCYCRGGEIKCTDVSCYVRNDCEGKQVQGQCCPKYDHCPTRDYLEKMATGVPTANLSFNFIGEETITPPSKEQPVNLDSYEFQVKNDSAGYSLYPTKQGNSVLIPRISIQEVLPENKIDPTSNLQMKLHPVNDLTNIVKNKSTDGNHNIEVDINDLSASDSDAEPSEIEEVIHNPPPVIRIGDNLLFLRKNELVNEKDASSTPTSIITLIGAEGLQRGGLEEVVENITNAENTENLYPAYTPEEDNDLSSESSSHILSLVKKKKAPTTPTTTLSPSSTSTTYVNVSTSGLAQSSPTPLVSSSSPSSESITQTSSKEHSSTDASYSSITGQQAGNIEPDLEQNPAYPTIPDIITRYTDEGWIRVDSANDVNQNNSTTEKINMKESRILPAILEIRSNKTLPVNVTNIDWLKSNYHENITSTFTHVNADSILETTHSNIETEKSIEDADDATTPILDNSTSVEWEEIITSTEPQLHPQIEAVEHVEKFNDSQFENITQAFKENVRSIESVENSGEYNGENVTPKEKNTVAIASMEDASVEDQKSDSEVNDMLFVKEYTIDLSNDEEKVKIKTKQNATNFFDVEIINTTELEKSEEIHEKLPSPEKTVLINKTIHKRENNQQNIDDAVFSELQQELGLGSTEKPKTIIEEELEARKIFQELLEETSTTKSQKTFDMKTKDSETLEKITQALAKLALRNTQALDIGALSVLKDFFTSQYRAYESKEP